MRLNELIELPDFDYDTIKVEFQVEGARRTVNLARLDLFRPYYDITEDVELGANGFPAYASIDEIAHDHLDRFIEAARLT